MFTTFSGLFDAFLRFNNEGVSGSQWPIWVAATGGYLNLIEKLLKTSKNNRFNFYITLAVFEVHYICIWLVVTLRNREYCE